MSSHQPDSRQHFASSEADAASSMLTYCVGANPAQARKPLGFGARLSALARRFRASSDGNIAIMTVLVMTPMLGLAGLAIDYSAAARSKDRLEQAAQIAATTAANAARNVLNVAGPNGAALTNADFGRNGAENENDNERANLDARAMTEGKRIGESSFAAQVALLTGITASTGGATVTRVGNTITAKVPYTGSSNTLLLKIFNVPTMSYSGEGKMIIGVQDQKSDNSTISERWSADALTSTYDLPTSSNAPIIKDWYMVGRSSSPIKIGPPPIDEAGLSTNLGTTTAVQTSVGPAALKIGAGTNGGLTKKVYLAAGNYEFRYWYKSAVVYPTYEPLYICGSDVREWDWVTDTRWRSDLAGTTTGTAALSSLGGVFLEPVTVNPQTANTPPTTFDAGNFVDGCAYSARWIERTASFKVNNAGYYWLSIVSQATGTANGFYLGQTRLCASACAGDPNNNSPWKTQPVTLTTDSFETLAPQADSAAFQLTTPFGYTHALYKTPITNWNFRQVTTRTNVEAVTNRIVTTRTLTPPTTISPANPQIVIRRPNASAGDTNSVQFNGAYTSLTRSLLLLPGVYKLTFPITSPPQAPSYTCGGSVDYKPYVYPTYFRTDYPSSPSYGGSPPPFALNDSSFAEREFMQNFMYHKCSSSGNFQATEVYGGYYSICFLVLRAHSYDVGLMTLDKPGMRFDDIKLELLTSKFLNPSAASSTDPRSTVDMATKNSCDETGVYTTNKIHIQYAYVTGYPQYTTYSRGGGRFTVTHNKYP